MATQLAQQTDTTPTTTGPCCMTCGTPLEARTPASACKHRINSIRFAEFFWEEA